MSQGPEQQPQNPVEDSSLVEMKPFADVELAQQALQEGFSARAILHYDAYGMITGDDENAFVGTLWALTPSNPQIRYTAATEELDRIRGYLGTMPLSQQARANLSFMHDQLQKDVERGIDAFRDFPDKPGEFQKDSATYAKENILKRLGTEVKLPLPEDVLSKIADLIEGLSLNPFDTEMNFRSGYAEWRQFRDWFSEQFKTRDDFVEARKYEKYAWDKFYEDLEKI